MNLGVGDAIQPIIILITVAQLFSNHSMKISSVFPS